MFQLHDALSDEAFDKKVLTEINLAQQARGEGDARITGGEVHEIGQWIAQVRIKALTRALIDNDIDY